MLNLPFLWVKKCCETRRMFGRVLGGNEKYRRIGGAGQTGDDSTSCKSAGTLTGPNTYSVITSNLCLMPEFIAHINNLHSSRERGKMIAKLFCGETIPNAKRAQQSHGAGGSKQVEAELLFSPWSSETFNFTAQSLDGTRMCSVLGEAPSFLYQVMRVHVILTVVQLVRISSRDSAWAELSVCFMAGKHATEQKQHMFYRPYFSCDQIKALKPSTFHSNCTWIQMRTKTLFCDSSTRNELGFWHCRRMSWPKVRRHIRALTVVKCQLQCCEQQIYKHERSPSLCSCKSGRASQTFFGNVNNVLYRLCSNRNIFTCRIANSTCWKHKHLYWNTFCDVWNSFCYVWNTFCYFWNTFCYVWKTSC